MRTRAQGLYLALALGLAYAPPALATPWHTLGPRAMGMGGAFVAVAHGPLASYWNPAGLGQLYDTSGLELPVSARGEFTGSVLQGANDLNQLSKDCQAAAASCTAAKIGVALDRVAEFGNGAHVDVGVGLDLKIKRVVVFANSLSYVGATPEVDRVNVGACSGAGCVDRNQSKLLMRGGIFTEFGVGYGREIAESGLILGGNLKGIVGKVGYTEFLPASEDPEGGSLGKFTRDSKTSFQPAVDLGLLWDVRETLPNAPMRPRLGIVGRNINNPTFTQPDSAKAAGDRSRFSLHGQGRAGLALSPFKWWHLAADMDLTDNVTYIDGFKSRYLSAGTEINVFNRPWLNIPLRVGLQKNLSNAASGLSYTAGFGLNFVHVVLDLGAMVSARATTLQAEGKSEQIRNNVAGAARFALLFGGTDEGPRDERAAPRPRPEPKAKPEAKPEPPPEPKPQPQPEPKPKPKPKPKAKKK